MRSRPFTRFNLLVALVLSVSVAVIVVLFLLAGATVPAQADPGIRYVAPGDTRTQTAIDTMETNDAGTPTNIMPAAITNINFALRSGGSITGHVYESDGVTPIQGASVRASGPDIPEADYGYSAFSQADGSYTISGLLSGTYRVKADAHYRAVEWYNGKTSHETADLVTVVAPGNASDIDFTLDPGGEISGYVFKADGVTAITDTSFVVVAEGVSPGSTDAAEWTSQTDGSYTLRGLTAGTYKVQANNNRAPGYVVEYYDNKSSWEQADTVVVTTNQTTTGINFALEPGGSISGRVYEQDGVTPVADGCVNASSTAPSWNQVAGFCCTGADGSFTINSVPAMTVYVKTDANCRGAHPYLVDEWYAVPGSTPDGNQATPVVVITGQTTSGITFALDPSGVISGHIFKADGSTVITDTQISVHASGVSTGASSKGTYASQTNGSYTIRGLLPGTYKVQANNNRAPGYVAKYYDNKYNWDQANTIQVTVGQTTADIDFALEPGGSISGYAYQADGITPIPNARVFALDTSFVSIGSSTSQADGSYRISCLASGNYYVPIRATGYGGVYYDNGYDDPHATQVTVTAPADTADINFRLSPEATVSGRVYESDGITPVGGATVRVWPQHGGQTRSSTTDVTGVYTVGGLSTGFYVVKVTATGHQYEYYQGALSWDTATPISVTQPANTPNIDFALGRGAATTVPTNTNTALVYTNTQALTTTVEVPPGAVTQTVTLVYSPVETATTPSGFAFAGNAFDLDVYQGSTPLPGFQFESAVTITLYYSDTDVAGLDETALSLDYWNEGASQWEDAATTCTPPSTYDRHPDENWLAVPICHLSKFALFGQHHIYLPLVLRN